MVYNKLCLAQALQTKLPVQVQYNKTQQLAHLARPLVVLQVNLLLNLVVVKKQLAVAKNHLVVLIILLLLLLLLVQLIYRVQLIKIQLLLKNWFKKSLLRTIGMYL